MNRVIQPEKSTFFRNVYSREIIIFLFSFLFLSYWSLLGVDFHHDGVMLIPAVEVSRGGIVFRDVFCQYGLLVPLLQGLAVSIFGEELLVIRLLTVIFYSGSVVLLDLLWKRFLPEKLSYFVPVMFFLLHPAQMVTFHSWNSVYALFFMLLSVYFLIRHLEKDTGKKYFIFLSGIAGGLALTARTPCGIVTAIALLLILGGFNWYTGKTCKGIIYENVLWIGGFLTIILCALLYLLISGAFSDCLKQIFGFVLNFVYERGGEGNWVYFCDSLLPFYQKELGYCNMFFAVMPLGALGLFFMLMRKGIRGGHAELKKHLPLMALLLLGLGSWHQYYPVPCVRHLFWGGVPLFGAYLLMLHKLFCHGKVGRIFCFAGILILLFCILPRAVGFYHRFTFRRRLFAETKGVKYLLLNIREQNAMKNVFFSWQLSPELLKKGVVNWTEDSLFTIMLPASGFKEVQFYRFDSAEYPGYDKKIFSYIMEHRPAVLTDHELFIPGYVAASSVAYMGKIYRILIPSE